MLQNAILVHLNHERQSPLQKTRLTHSSHLNQACSSSFSATIPEHFFHPSLSSSLPSNGPGSEGFAGASS